MKKVLITGGPVHAKLDAVKFVTNRFKGGMMADLARRLSDTGLDVTYITAKGGKVPTPDTFLNMPVQKITVVYHDGFYDYKEKVLAMAKDYDAVILGAAVANLIPVCYYGKPEMIGSFNSAPTVGERVPMPLDGKFPSHNYKPGDIIRMDWTIAPRVIDEVKAHMKPGAHLIGFKLLEGVPHDELIRAAYGVLKESHSSIVFANDANDLKQKYAVTKEFGEVPMDFGTMTPFILRLMEDEYYSTCGDVSWTSCEGLQYAFEKVNQLIKANEDNFVQTGDMKFGTVAWRATESGKPVVFVTTARGKKELTELSCVMNVDHSARTILSLKDSGKVVKASLNAPLLERIFNENDDVWGILHFHRQEPGLVVQPWAPPGTVRDTMRDVRKPFNVQGHGCYLYLDHSGNIIRRA